MNQGLPGWFAAAGDLDDVMFEPAGWFAIDASNRRVPRVVVATRELGLGLVDQPGPVASVVGRLRPGFVVVDVDVSDPVGTTVVRRLESWLTTRDAWFLVRPSGGGPGRFHVFIATPGGVAAGEETDTLAGPLAELVTLLRTQFILAHKQLEVRTSVRPLTAPHRHGGLNRPVGSIRSALARLRAGASGEDTPSPAGSTVATGGAPRGRGEIVQNRRGGAEVVALMPALRRRRDLPAEWVRYLATGVAPEVGGRDTGPSTLGVRVTDELIRAGYTVDEAWAAIAGAHPAALTHTRDRHRGRGWWIRHVWNVQVRDDHAFLSTQTTTQHHRQHGRQGAGGREDVDPAARAWRPRSRPRGRTCTACSTPGPHVLDTGSGWWGRCCWTAWSAPAPWWCRARNATWSRTPACPARPSRPRYVHSTAPPAHRPRQSACGRAWESCWRAAGELLDSFDPTDREHSSHTFALAARYAAAADGVPRGVSQLLPPVPHTPDPHPGPAGLRRAVGSRAWSVLGVPAFSLWSELLELEGAGVGLGVGGGVLLEELAGRAGLGEGLGKPASERQLRTARRYLGELARHGLAVVLASGRWSLPKVLVVSEELAAAAEAKLGPVDERVALERAAYRSAPGAAWRRVQADAIARERAKARERYQAWRERTTATAAGREQLRARSRRLAREFAHATVEEQAGLKSLWAHRRRQRLAGSEAARHDEWCRSMPDAEYTRRVVERAADFARLAGPEQAARVMAWQQHRGAWRIPHGHPDERGRSQTIHPGNAGAMRLRSDVDTATVAKRDAGQLELALATA